MGRGKKRKKGAGHTTEATLPLVAFHIFLPSSQPPYGKIGTLSIDNGDGNENSKKAKVFLANNNFARASRFFVHFLAVVARLRTCKCLISRFVEDGNTRKQVSFSFPAL